jgi:hypothetical protein
MSTFEIVLYLCDVYTAFSGGRVYENSQVTTYQWFSYVILLYALMFWNRHETLYQYLFIFCTLVTIVGDTFY